MASIPIDFTKPPDTSNLKGKTALVTGGASGIGHTLALALNAAGARVTIADINISRSTAETVRSEVPLESIKCDVTSWESQVAAFKSAAQNSSSGTVDIVISAAGIRTQIAYVPAPTPGSEPQKPPTGKHSDHGMVLKILWLRGCISRIQIPFELPSQKPASNTTVRFERYILTFSPIYPQAPSTSTSQAHTTPPHSQRTTSLSRRRIRQSRCSSSPPWQHTTNLALPS